jgi:hypothetical protein
MAMPKGNPTPQTIASEKYQKKAGWMTKGFKLKRDVVEEFEEACEKAGVSQASKITELMKQFIKEVKASE